MTPDGPDGPDGTELTAQAESLDLGTAVATLARFLHRRPLTEVIATFENQLQGAGAVSAARTAAEGHVDAHLLAAAFVVREDLGRINDIIHAAGILLALPHVLQDGETVVNRPSLGAGNDPSRPYDLETDRRVAEFKFFPGGAVRMPLVSVRRSRTW